MGEEKEVRSPESGVRSSFADVVDHPARTRVTALRAPLLFLNVLIIATCGLIYELLAGTVASYLLGDSVTQFSLVIGLYLSALGAGAWLSRFIDHDLGAKFIDVELGVAIAGGFSAPLLFVLFARIGAFQLVLFALVFIIGVIVGLELPLLMRILREQVEFKELVSRVLSVDYIGSLVAAVLFPIFLVPKLGLVRTSLVFGLLNALVGLYGTFLLRPILQRDVRPLRVRAVVVIALIVAALFRANWLTALGEEELYADPIVYSKTTPYQRILITQSHAGFQLFLNNNLQFSSSDEYRYHEALVHPALSLRGAPERVLILGGGDGLALREVLKYASVREVVLVDLDPAMTTLADHFPPLRKLNGNSFHDPRVHVINADAMIWLEQHGGRAYSPSPRTSNRRDRGDGSVAGAGYKPALQFDAAIVDFPDPNNYALGKLYTTRFYRLLRNALAPEATVAVQCTSPLYARKSYWCIIGTIEAAGFQVRPYQTTVPAFGVWGYALASPSPLPVPTRVPAALRYLDAATTASMFVMPRDMARVPAEINRLDNQVLVRYYENEWKHWE